MRRVAALALALLAAPAAAAPRPRPGAEIRVLLPGPPGDLDPARAISAADLLAARALHATLLELDGSGSLQPGLAELPEQSPDGRELRIRIRPGLRFHDGAPVTAADAVESLSRLLRPETGSPHGWIAAAIEGAETVREGRARVPAGLQATSELELRVQLAFPFALFPRALAAAPAAVVHGGVGSAAGAGPFRPSARTGESLRLAAFDGHCRGRPWAASLLLSWPDAAAAARLLARGEAELALRPEGVQGMAVRDQPLLTAVALSLNARRLGPAAEPLREILAGLDRAELARLLRGPARPMPSLLLPGPSTATATPAHAPAHGATPPGRIPGLPARLVLLTPASLRALADRIQVKLFDRGVKVGVETVPDGLLPARLASGGHDLAVFAEALASGDPALALAQLAQGMGGAARSGRLLREIAPGDATALASAAARVEEELAVVPIAVAALRASARPALQGLEILPDGSLDPGDLWQLPERARER